MQSYKATNDDVSDINASNNISVNMLNSSISHENEHKKLERDIGYGHFWFLIWIS